MRYSKPTDRQLTHLLTQILPAAQAAGAVSGPGGLGSGALRIETRAGALAARPALWPGLPGVYLRRQQRALCRAGEGIGPRVLGCTAQWLVCEWLEGDVKPAIGEGDIAPLAAVLQRLHQRPLFGWRVPVLWLVNYYWQAADPARRSPGWLRVLKRLTQRREPRPLRLAPLHMDIHSGNIVWQPAGLRLIDWEYAGDGDIALELAAAGVESEHQRQLLIAEYARLSGIDRQRLACQVDRWRPWTGLLAASWYEQRWQQTGDTEFIALAETQWSALRRWLN
ncbi:thiamine kinase [Shimwellia blattae]|uniref:Thiamine kinase n=1 Tax=Shimwellia blattae (strain ATCC 29907 / DSM 4481 / JCM 1650 / NBRC 105725 / CDC 9005-74) TaxID=630626 RepID=I2BAD0_SHIBC|nr:thiamine kinase [Shimwellia blattae]AFJ47484.1 thiamine kinase [Shimwellia blattae DSM 4481 = NBRC 105725]VDY64981.1 Thiamine kinase [Shimwellia blattae]VEC23267.1 Thiamine kinase [Shimwellia blattae]